MLLNQASNYSQLESDLYNTLNPRGMEQFLGLEKTAIEFCGSLVIRYFEEMGLKSDIGEILSFSECLTFLGIKEHFERMLSLFFRILSQLEIIEEIQGRDTVVKNWKEIPSIELILQKIKDLYPRFTSFFAFLERCAQSYPQVLSGEVPGATVLFPAQDPSSLQRVYESTPKIGHEELYLYLVRDVLRDRIETASEASIIEVGAGQGILTEIVLPSLSQRALRYTFTDIGPSFLKAAQQKWGAYYPFLDFAVYDASQDPLTQGFQPESYDVLLGFNVIHATPNIASAVMETSKLVKEGGIICFVENVKVQVWIDMIYGLTEGWWLFDDQVRTTSPLLSIGQWKDVLSECSFSQVHVFPTNTPLRNQTDTALIIIEK